MVNQAGKWYSRGVGNTWNLVKRKEPNDNDKHGNLNHFLEMNEYDMMDYEQHLVINEFKVFDGAWFLVNINYKAWLCILLGLHRPQDLRASLHEQLRGHGLQWLAVLGEVCLQGQHLHPTFLPIHGGQGDGYVVFWFGAACSDVSS